MQLSFVNAQLKQTKIPVTCLVELVNLQLETSLAVLMMDQQTGSLWTRSKIKNDNEVMLILIYENFHYTHQYNVIIQ